MKPVIEANFKPFESVRFRQNASLVSKDQLAARQHQAISQYRLKVRQAQNYGISSPESMICIQDIRQAFDLQDTVQRVHGTANVSGSGNSFCDPFSGSPAVFRKQGRVYIHAAVFRKIQNGLRKDLAKCDDNDGIRCHRF